jgi:Na+:H+ antiporter, NhaA family
MSTDGSEYPLERLFGTILSPFERFIRRTTAGGIVLVGTAVLAMALANSPWSTEFHHFWETPLGVGIAGGRRLGLSLHEWVNEGLMTLFFLLVGLELKREILVGELSSLRNAVLPVAGAAGGMIVPALVYHAFNPSGPAAAGWGIPMATDIAFAVGILVLLAWRIPRSLIVFLTALAIADDLGEVLVIAVFYTARLDPLLLGCAAVVVLGLVLLNRGGVRRSLPYAVLGLLLWVFLLRSGIHATVAGVMLAAVIPSRPAFTLRRFDRCLDEMRAAFHAFLSGAEPDDEQHSDRLASIAQSLEFAATAVQSPQQRMERVLSPWVTFGVIPLFALANAGIDVTGLSFAALAEDPVTLGIVVGLVAGKFIGVAAGSWLAVRAGFALLPAGVGWRHILGAAWLAGIGFTMSLFIGQLAFSPASVHAVQAKLGVIAASLFAAPIGLAWLYFGAPGRRNGAANGGGGGRPRDAGAAARPDSACGG